MKTLKESFIENIKFMYPEGLDWDKQKAQHRDIIRIYSMGMMSAYENVHDRNPGSVDVESNAWMAECKPIADLNWWPDKSWRW